MIKKSYLLLLLLVLGTFYEVKAQQDAQYTQYMFNTMTINPGYAGSRGQLSIAALYRSQWVGLKGAPKSQTLNLHSPIRNSRIGYGVSIFNDNIGEGAKQQTNFDAAISYTIDVSQTGKLSFGLNAGGQLLDLDLNKLENYFKEPVSSDNIEHKFSPNFGVGIYYHTNKFYAGFSAPRLLETEHFDNSENQDPNKDGITFLSKDRVNFYFITGYVFDLNSYIKLKPALLTKAVGGAPLQIDVSASFLFNEKFSFGAAYRWDAAVSGLAGFQITDQFMLGLAYDRETTALGGTQFNDGSFEVFLRFELVRAYQRLVSPRFF